MAEYIEREALLKHLGVRWKVLREENGWLDQYAGGFGDAVDEVEYFDTADVVEVRHGEWVDTGILELDTIYGGWKCSVCGDIVCGSKPNYCGNCGAKMDGKGEGE